MVLEQVVQQSHGCYNWGSLFLLLCSNTTIAPTANNNMLFQIFFMLRVHNNKNTNVPAKSF